MRSDAPSATAKSLRELRGVDYSASALVVGRRRCGRGAQRTRLHHKAQARKEGHMISIPQPSAEGNSVAGQTQLRRCYTSDDKIAFGTLSSAVWEMDGMARATAHRSCASVSRRYRVHHSRKLVKQHSETHSALSCHARLARGGTVSPLGNSLFW